VKGGGAVDITVDFDLSISIVVTGPDEYKLKPVLHIVHTSEAATIQGTIADESFDNTGSSNAIVTILDNIEGLIQIRQNLVSFGSFQIKNIKLRSIWIQMLTMGQSTKRPFLLSNCNRGISLL
jgi:hypothetical protein